MENTCKGCGAVLQIDSKDERGYAKSLDNEFCQSCFRLRHYNDFKHVRADVNDGDILDFLQSFEGTVFWIIDIMNINQSMHPGLMRTLLNKKVVLLANKRDLLPKQVNKTKLTHGLMRAMKDFPLKFEEVQFVSAKKRDTLTGILPYLEAGNVAFVGAVNAGKSSILNALLGNDALSVSPVASTTADVIEIKVNDYTLFDTPGLQNESKLTHVLSDESLLRIAPQKRLKPQTFQIYEKQSIVIADLGTITIDPVKSCQVVVYLPLEAKRIKPDRIENNLKNATLKLLDEPSYKKRAYPKQKYNVDLEFFDLGFVNIQGEFKSLETYFDKNVEIIYRRALI